MPFIKNLLQLYRIDVFVITFINGIGGYFFSYGTVNTPLFWRVLFISGVLYNYVYVLNAITDIGVDKINKPTRPLPSGRISQKSAVIYLLFIVVVSIIGIILLFEGLNMAMAFLVLIIGGLYSLPPFELKNIPILAPFITGWGVVHPMFITGNEKAILPGVILTCYATGTALLKDLSDLAGDSSSNRKVVTTLLSIRHLMIVSMVLTLLAAVLCLFLAYPIIFIAPFATFLTTLYHFIFKSEEEIKEKVYKRMALSVASVGSIALILAIVL